MSLLSFLSRQMRRYVKTRNTALIRVLSMESTASTSHLCPKESEHNFEIICMWLLISPRWQQGSYSATLSLSFLLRWCMLSRSNTHISDNRNCHYLIIIDRLVSGYPQYLLQPFIIHLRVSTLPCFPHSWLITLPPTSEKIKSVL